jgi:hypothetical protein
MAYVHAMLQELRAMALVWRSLDPNNVAPFLRLLELDNGLTIIILPYYSNGNIIDFLRAYPDADRLSLVRNQYSCCILHVQTTHRSKGW